MKKGIRAAAAPVFGVGGKLIGSLAVVGTFSREAAKTYGPQVAAAAKKFSESIGGAPTIAHSGTTPQRS